MSEEKSKPQFSIHPRVSYPNGVKKNTCKPHKGGGKLAKRMKRLAARRLAHSATLQSLPSTANPRAFIAPGSMKA